MRKFTIFTQVTGQPTLAHLTIAVSATRSGACRQALGDHRAALVAAGHPNATRVAIHVQTCRETAITAAPKVGDRVPVR